MSRIKRIFWFGFVVSILGLMADAPRNRTNRMDSEADLKQ